MIYFAQAQYLLLLLLVPVFLIVYGLVQYGRTRRIRKFGDEALVQQLMPSYSKPYNESSILFSSKPRFLNAVMIFSFIVILLLC